MGLSLYEISDQYKAVLNDLESMDDLDEQVLADTLEPYMDDLEAKCLNVAAYIKNLDAEEKAIKEAEQSLCFRRNKIAARKNAMKSYLAKHLPHKLSDSQTVISPRKGSERVVMIETDLKMLPARCVKTESKAVLTEVKKWLKEDPEIAGKYAKIEIGAPTVTIK